MATGCVRDREREVSREREVLCLLSPPCQCRVHQEGEPTARGDGQLWDDSLVIRTWYSSMCCWELQQPTGGYRVMNFSLSLSLSPSLSQMHPVNQRSRKAPMTAGTVISSHHQVRLKAGCRHPVQPLLRAVCQVILQDTKSSGTCILTTSLRCDTSATR